MIYLYISPSCQSCRKTVKWFNDENIPYETINILKDKLTKEDVFRMLKNSLNGFDDIISKRSKPFVENNLEIEEMKTSELIDFIINNPTVLKRPIICLRWDIILMILEPLFHQKKEYLIELHVMIVQLKIQILAIITIHQFY